MPTTTGGIITTDFNATDDGGRTIALQPDGKLVVAGFSFNGSDDDIALARYNSSGSLDNSFSGDGKVTTAIASLSNDSANLIKLEADGKILLYGVTTVSGGKPNLVMVRYNSDGSLDTSFGSDGKITTDIAFFTSIAAIRTQADGKVLVAGTYHGSSTYDNLFALARYNSDGSLDTSFSSDGKVTTVIPYLLSNNNYVSSMSIQTDGKILVAGDSNTNEFCLVRYNTNGTLDTSFDGDGTLDFLDSREMGSLSLSSVTAQPDGKILVVGKGNWVGLILARLNSNGSLDDSFDGDGIATTLLNSYNMNYPASVVIQPDGKLLVAGSIYNGANYNFLLVRYNSNGSLDTSFDGDGIVNTSISSYSDSASSVIALADGKLLVVGKSSDGSSNADFALVRYNPDGSLDTTFNGTSAPPILNITATDANKIESSSPFTFTVNRTGDISSTATVKYAVSVTTASASDFTSGILPAGVVSFAANEASKVITIPVANDSIVEPDETFNVVLSNPLGATLGIATATGIIRNDANLTTVLSIIATDADKIESSGAFTFTINRTGNISSWSVVNYGVSEDGTASILDFVLPRNGWVNFAANETSKVITINIANDSVVEPDETFNVVLSNPSGATLGIATATGIIRNDDVATSNTLTGTAKNDVLLGTIGNDFIIGLAGNDTLTGGIGNDSLDGGDGLDTAVYTGNLANFVITKTITGLTIKDNTGVNGTDTVKNIEKLQFTDVSINLSVQTKAATSNIPAAVLKSIEELYSGFFKRIPDADGLAYWIDQYKGGKTVNQIADAFYDAGVQYANTTGYSSTMTSGDFIKIVYANVLGRTGSTAPNQTEIDFWNQKLIAGTETRGSVVTSMLDIVHTQYANDAIWGWVGKLLDNKTVVAQQFAVVWGITYATPETSITKGMEIASAVTDTDTTAAISLVGVNSVFV